MLRRNNFVSAVLIVVITSPHPVPCELGEFFLYGGLLAVDNSYLASLERTRRTRVRQLAIGRGQLPE